MKTIKTTSGETISIRKYVRQVEIKRLTGRGCRCAARRALWVDESGRLWAKSDGRWVNVTPTDTGYIRSFLAETACEVADR